MLSVGLDLSYSRTGFAVVDRSVQDGTKVSFDRYPTPTTDSFVKRTVDIKNWIMTKLNELEKVEKVDVIVVEGPGLDGSMAALMNGLDTSILVYLYEVRTWSKIIVVPPRTLKKYHGAKGKGKSPIVERAKELIPNLKGICHDEADALFLALLGADYLSLGLNPRYESMLRDAQWVLFNTEPNKKGAPKGLIHRIGEFYFPER